MDDVRDVRKGENTKLTLQFVAQLDFFETLFLLQVLPLGVYDLAP